MGKVAIKVPNGPPDRPLLSRAVRAGDFVFVSGHAGLLPNRPASGEGTTWMPGELAPGGIGPETRQAFESIKAALATAGATLSDVVQVNSYLRDVDRDFLAYNRVYTEYIPTEPPARASVGGKIYGIYLVEIECIAYAPLSKDEAR